MKQQRAIHTTPGDKRKLMDYLNEGWTVVSVTAYRPSCSNNDDLGTMLVIIEKEN